ncbi:helix-turn-helix domain-containing protein, partial [Demequina sp. NBRC 110051]|uniref:helix-turn-helix domain-containing protein n=1 Tax=Demequina sp. NBRC 110051 TaxID=1570340 RepID=UPI00135653D7
MVAVIEGGLSISEAARRFGVTRQWVHRLLARYRAGGLDALEPRSRAPRSSPSAIPDELRQTVIAMRDSLVADGWDAGADSIRDRLIVQGVTPPSRATVHRIVVAADRVIAQPRKRPRSSWIRFEAAVPNETWQSDMTHWHLADGTAVEIISWMDDHSRFLLHISAHKVVTAPIVTETFLETARIHGLPASTLTDNGLIYTTRFAAGKGGPNHFEHVIEALGIRSKMNGHPRPPANPRQDRTLFHQ